MSDTITTNNHFLVRNRNHRNELLKKTDYLMLPDVYEALSEEQKEELNAYRQTLRNFINDNKDKHLIEDKWNIPFPDIPSWPFPSQILHSYNHL
jgi:hypothetical protein